MATILLIILILLLIGAIPAWPHSSGLGLLAKWRIRFDSFDCNHPRVNRTYLSDLIVSARMATLLTMTGIGISQSAVTLRLC